MGGGVLKSTLLSVTTNDMIGENAPSSSDRAHTTTLSAREAERPLVWALKMNSDLDKEEARELITAALAGDHEAQREIDVNLLQESKGTGSEKMKQAMKQLLELLARGELTKLESARAELQVKYEARRHAKKVQCAQHGTEQYPTQRKSSVGCWSTKRGVSRGRCHQAPDQRQKTVLVL